MSRRRDAGAEPERGRSEFELPLAVSRSELAVDAELRSHMEEHAADLIARGTPAAEAWAQATATFAELDATRALLYRMDARATRLAMIADALRDLSVDVKRAVRGIMRRPAPALLAACTLGLGIGANATMYGLVDRLLVNGPPHIADPERVVSLTFDEAQRPGSGRQTSFSTAYPAYQELTSAPGLNGVAAWVPIPLTLLDSGQARMAAGVAVTPNYFEVLGVSAVHGTVRSLASDDQWAVISHALWTTAFQRRADVLGRTFSSGGEFFRIIGVAPRGFSGPSLEPSDVWVPIAVSDRELGPSWMSRSDIRPAYVTARLRDGVGLDAAAATASARYRRAIEGTALADSTARVVLTSVMPGRLANIGAMSPVDRMVASLQIVSLLVLAIALFNVLNLFLLRAVERQRETAIALALGISGVRLTRFLLLEYLLVAGASAGLALGMVWLVAPVIWRVALPAGTDAGALMSEVFGATAWLALIAVVFLTVVSAAVQRRTQLAPALRDGARGSSRRHDRLRDSLVIAQVALTVALAVGAGLFVQSLSRANRVDWGFDTRDVVAVRLSPAELELDGPATAALAARAAERLRAIPGVLAVATSQGAPLQPSMRAPFRLPGREDLPGVGPDGVGFPTFFAVSTEFLDVLGIRLLQGRGFDASDTQGSAPVVIIDATMARTFWPTGGALGQCVRVGQDPAPCRTVVGIVEDTKRWLDERQHHLRYFLPLAQSASGSPQRFMFVRTTEGRAAALLGNIRQSLASEHPAAGVSNVVTMQSMVDPYTVSWRLGTSMFLALGVMAQVIAALGLYGIVSFGVAARQRELGIRLALGADRASVVWHVVRSALRRVVIAMALGVAIALPATHLLRSLLYATPATDPFVYAGVLGLALIVAVMSSAIPAWGAGRVDPATALRSD